MGLIDDLKKTESLQGNDMDTALLSIKEKYNSPSDKETIKKYFLDECGQIESELNSVNEELDNLLIKDQLKNIRDILPIAYIAKKYFKKSSSWLYQRLNGNKVRGRVYTLNNEEIEIFNRALQEIGTQISSLSITR